MPSNHSRWKLSVVIGDINIHSTTEMFLLNLDEREFKICNVYYTINESDVGALYMKR